MKVGDVVATMPEENDKEGVKAEGGIPIVRMGTVAMIQEGHLAGAETDKGGRRIGQTMVGRISSFLRTCREFDKEAVSRYGLEKGEANRGGV